jgi:hypothetical protein
MPSFSGIRIIQIRKWCSTAQVPISVLKKYLTINVTIVSTSGVMVSSTIHCPHQRFTISTLSIQSLCIFDSCELRDIQLPGKYKRNFNVSSEGPQGRRKIYLIQNYSPTIWCKIIIKLKISLVDRCHCV